MVDDLWDPNLDILPNVVHTVHKVQYLLKYSGKHEQLLLFIDFDNFYIFFAECS